MEMTPRGINQGEFKIEEHPDTMKITNVQKFGSGNVKFRAIEFDK